MHKRFANTLDYSALRMVRIFEHNPYYGRFVAPQIVAEGDHLREEIDRDSEGLSPEESAWIHRESGDIISALGHATRALDLMRHNGEWALDCSLGLACNKLGRVWLLGIQAYEDADICACLVKCLRVFSKLYLMQALAAWQARVDIDNFVRDVENARHERKTVLNERARDTWDLLKAVGSGKKPVLSDFQGLLPEKALAKIHMGIYLREIADGYDRLHAAVMEE